MGWPYGGVWEGVVVDQGRADILAALCRAINERRELVLLSPVEFLTGNTYPTAADFDGLSVGEISGIVAAMETKISDLINGAMDFGYTRYVNNYEDNVVWTVETILADVGLGSFSSGGGITTNTNTFARMKGALDLLTCTRINPNHMVGPSGSMSVYEGQDIPGSYNWQTAYDNVSLAYTASSSSYGGISAFSGDGYASIQIIVPEYIKFDTTRYTGCGVIVGGGVVKLKKRFTGGAIDAITFTFDGQEITVAETGTVTKSCVFGIDTDTTFDFDFFSDLPADVPFDDQGYIDLLLDDRTTRYFFLDQSSLLTDQT